MPRLLGCASLLVLGAIPLPLSFFLCLFLGCSQNGSAVAPEDEDVATTRARLLSLPAPDPSVNLQFGTSVAADSQTLIIGDSQALATSTDNQQHNKGQVHIYARSGGIESWTPLQVLKPFGPVNGEVHFGEHLALHGNLLVVSADRDALDCPSYPCPNPADDSQQGAFYVFSRTAPGQSFTRVGTKFTEPSPVRENRFGLLVATNGRFIAATAGVTDGGNGFDVQVFTVQANGSVVRSYGIDPTLKPLAMTMTESGILAVIPSNGPRWAPATSTSSATATPSPCSTATTAAASSWRPSPAPARARSRPSVPRWVSGTPNRSACSRISGSWSAIKTSRGPSWPSTSWSAGPGPTRGSSTHPWSPA
jgi:hypothetical protein